MQMKTVTAILLILTFVGLPPGVAQMTAGGASAGRPTPAPDGEPARPEPSDEPDPFERDVLHQAVQRYRETGVAAVVTRSDAVVFPFGESQPKVRCTPLRACDIELQAGETITGVALGDTERWVTSPLESGDAASPTPHVIVKPVEYELATNLVIGTDRRTYHIALMSPSKEEAASSGAAYFRRVTFYYPQDLVEEWSVAKRRRREEEADRRQATTAEVSALSVAELNFDYRIKGDRKVPWAPVTVFDDGRHVYIRLPETVRSTDLPALIVAVEGGGMAISNYRLKGTWLIVDGLFERAELVAGVGRKRKKVVIRNRDPIRGGA